MRPVRGCHYGIHPVFGLDTSGEFPTSSGEGSVCFRTRRLSIPVVSSNTNRLEPQKRVLIIDDDASASTAVAALLCAILGFSMVVLDSLGTGEAINPEDLGDTMENIHEAGEQLHRIAQSRVLLTELTAGDARPGTYPAIGATTLTEWPGMSDAQIAAFEQLRLPETRTCRAPSASGASLPEARVIAIVPRPDQVLARSSVSMLARRHAAMRCCRPIFA